MPDNLSNKLLRPTHHPGGKLVAVLDNEVHTAIRMKISDLVSDQTGSGVLNAVREGVDE